MASLDQVHKVSSMDLACYFSCGLCKGFLIDATALPECEHTFCKKCIVLHCDTSVTCPTCREVIHSTKPLAYLKKDVTLQTLLFKLFPHVYTENEKRRRLFAVNFSDSVDCSDWNKPDILTKETSIISDPLPWLPQIVPDEIRVAMEYNQRLMGNFTDDVPESTKLLNEAGKNQQKLEAMCDSNVSAEEWKMFLRRHFKASDENTVVLLHRNEVIEDSQQLGDMVKFGGYDTDEKSGKKLLRLTYFFLPAKPYTTFLQQKKLALSLQLARPSLLLPMSGKIIPPKPRRRRDSERSRRRRSRKSVFRKRTTRKNRSKKSEVSKVDNKSGAEDSIVTSECLDEPKISVASLLMQETMENLPDIDVVRKDNVKEEQEPMIDFKVSVEEAIMGKLFHDDPYEFREDPVKEISDFFLSPKKTNESFLQ